MATIAVFVALGGTGYAAMKINGASIRKHSIPLNRLKGKPPRGAKGAQGERGERGVIGPAGLPGSAGLQGPEGHKGDTGPEGPTGPEGHKGDTGPATFTAWAQVWEGFVQADSSTSNIPSDFIYKPPATTGIYCTKSGTIFGGRRHFAITILGNAPGYATIRNSSLAACGSSEYSPYISTFDAAGDPADENFQLGIFE